MTTGGISAPSSASVSTKTSAAATPALRPMPKDAKVIAAMIRDSGITDYEPRVLYQLLEFNYRFVTTILEDAKVFSVHAKKKAVDIDDVKVAVQMHVNSNMTSPPNRELLMEMARVRNEIPLPTPKPLSGLRLPPDRFCLTANIYRLKNKQAKMKTPFYTPTKSVFGYGNQPFSLSVKSSSTPLVVMKATGAQEESSAGDPINQAKKRKRDEDGNQDEGRIE